MRIKHLIVLLIILVFVIQPVSAGFFGDILDKITGRVTEEVEEVTIESVPEEPVQEEPAPEPEPVKEEPIPRIACEMCEGGTDTGKVDENGCPIYTCPIKEEPVKEETCLPIPMSMWCPDCNIENYGNKCLCPQTKDEKGCLVWDCNACKPIEEPTSCKDSLDCPTKMKCENSVCVDVGCIQEGGMGPSAGINPAWLDHLPSECCEGLKSITYSRLYDENCNLELMPGAPSVVCTKCGDGQCGNGETKCNCPGDCKVEATCTDSDGGINYYVKGYVSLFDYPGGAIDKYDNCWDDGKHLTEYVCENGVYKGDHTYLCPDSCKDGACIKKEIPEPTPEVPPTTVPPGCKRIIREDGMEVIECEKECPPLPEEIIRKCKETGGKVVEKFYDSRGCPGAIDCEYAPKTPTFIVAPTECLPEEALSMSKKRCLNAGLEPILVKEGGCEVVKCSEKLREVVRKCAEDIEAVKKIKEECEIKGGKIVKHFDPAGCPMTVCAPPDEKECERSVPSEVNKNCELKGGDIVIKRDNEGCIRFIECVRRGNVDIIYEEVEEIPPAAKLLSIALKLESLKIEFDKMIRKLKSIVNYYEEIGNAAEAEKFSRVIGLFSSANDKIENIKVKLRERAKDITKEDLREIKHDIKYISELVMQDALYIILGGEIKLEGSTGVTKEGYTDCGSDSRCWAEALRLCEPIVFKPADTIVNIKGLEDEVCIIEASYKDTSMICKIKNYATISSEGQDILQYCEGSMVDLLKKQMTEAPRAQVARVMCTPEDEEASKECKERGGVLQKDFNADKGCEVYTGCILGEEIEEVLPAEEVVTSEGGVS